MTGLDALNGTPILDIKPYEEHFDSPVGIEREREPGYRPSDTYHGDIRDSAENICSKGK